MTTVLKLGGSVITDKDEPGSVAPDQLQAIGATLAGANGDIVVIHGGGSFGHPVADRHGVDPDRPTTDPLAVAEIHEAMLALNALVVEAFTAAGLRPIALHPMSMVTRSTDGLDVCLAPIESAVEQGFVPVLHGDGVLDDRGGVTVLSGDDLVVALASALDAERVGLCTDVDGVLDVNGTVIDRIETLDAVADALGGAEGVDVTGGMARKVELLLELGIPASIFSADELETFFAGGRPGTTVDASG